MKLDKYLRVIYLVVKVDGRVETYINILVNFQNQVLVKELTLGSKLSEP